MKGKRESQYFLSYSEPEASLFEDDFPCHYEVCLCIPAYDESTVIIDVVSKLASVSDKNLVLIMVINQPDTVEECYNNSLLHETVARGELVWQKGQCYLHRHLFFDVLLVDRFSGGNRIPLSEGVGKARKIASDIACKLFFLKKLDTGILFCSDADARFPDDYFTVSMGKNQSALVYGFSHEKSGQNDIDNATRVYEQSLLHYVNGLKHARSSYAYHSIGSCLAINAEYYIQARGFPKRAGGEDFYLLNKLNKLAPVQQLEEPVLRIQSRQSNRAAFGTGPAVQRLLEQGINSAPLFYHPECFEILKRWLQMIDKFSETGVLQPDNDMLTELLEKFALEAAAQKIFKNHKSGDARKIHMHQWFDAFKTLKLVHYLRDHYFSSLSYNEFINLAKRRNNNDGNSLNLFQKI